MSHVIDARKLVPPSGSPFDRVCVIADELARTNDFVAFGEQCVALIASYHQERYHQDTTAFLKRIESGAQCYEDILIHNPNALAFDITARTTRDMNEAVLIGLWHNLKTSIGQNDLPQFVEDLAIFEVQRKQAE